MRFLYLTCTMLLLLGCSSMPTQDNTGRWLQEMPFGKPRSEADKHFVLRNSDTGFWKAKMISTEVTTQGTRSIYRYQWIPSHQLFYDIYEGEYDLIFVDDKLVKFEKVSERTNNSTQQEKQGLGFLCKEAIARGDRGAMTVHCQ